MGTLSQGILGPMKNKTGPVVGFVWKGINALRSYNESPANPRTAAQVANRATFSYVQALASLFLAILVKPLWDRWASRMSGYNAFISANFPAFDDTGLINPSSFKLAQGSLTGVDTMSFTSANGNPDVNVTWVDNSGTGTALATDEFYALAYNANNDVWACIPTLEMRSALNVTITFDTNNSSGDTIYVWGCFRRDDGTLVSNTNYQTAIVP